MVCRSTEVVKQPWERADERARAAIIVTTLALEDAPAALWHEGSALLSAEEHAHAARFHFEADRRHYVAAHVLKRFALHQAAGRPARAWRFELGPFGKPFVAGGTGPHFNLTHCDGLVACAVSGDVTVGVDVEPLGRPIGRSVVGQSLTEAELAWLRRAPEAEQQQAFVRVWTLKEAFVKATGEGLSRDLQSFSIAFDPPRLARSADITGHREDWRFLQRIIGNRHVLGLCWHGPDAEVTIRTADLDAFLRLSH